jgi:hypothetical protein
MQLLAQILGMFGGMTLARLAVPAIGAIAGKRWGWTTFQRAMLRSARRQGLLLVVGWAVFSAPLMATHVIASFGGILVAIVSFFAMVHLLLPVGLESQPRNALDPSVGSLLGVAKFCLTGCGILFAIEAVTSTPRNWFAFAMGLVVAVAVNRIRLTSLVDLRARAAAILSAPPEGAGEGAPDSVANRSEGQQADPPDSTMPVANFAVPRVFTPLDSINARIEFVRVIQESPLWLRISLYGGWFVGAVSFLAYDYFSSAGFGPKWSGVREAATALAILGWAAVAIAGVRVFMVYRAHTEAADGVDGSR